LKGLAGAKAAWENQKDRGHHTLPLDILNEVKKSILEQTTSIVVAIIEDFTISHLSYFLTFGKFCQPEFSH